MTTRFSFSEMMQRYKYLVINKDETCEVYTSLREISQDIGVNFTTISKKLKINPNYCVCYSKTSKENYYITPLKI